VLLLFTVVVFKPTKIYFDIFYQEIQLSVNQFLKLLDVSPKVLVIGKFIELVSICEVNKNLDVSVAIFVPKNFKYHQYTLYSAWKGFTC